MSSPFTLDPDLLGALDDIPLLARNVVEGFLSGLHRSPFLGYSTEFASYRQYMQGDDLRHVDWKVWGRTDKLHVKQFESETNLSCHILLDTSASMDFGQPNKFHYGRALAAALAYLMVRQHDTPGLTLFGAEAIQGLPAHSGRRHLDDLFQLLAGAEPQGRAAPGPDFWNLLETFDRRGLTVVISDLLLPGDAVLNCFASSIIIAKKSLCFTCWLPKNWTSATTANAFLRTPKPARRFRFMPAVSARSICGGWPHSGSVSSRNAKNMKLIITRSARMRR